MERAIVIAGAGGQGVIFMGEVLACAAMNKGMNVTLFPSYGVEKIGGTSKCTVIISDDLIGSPVTDKIDILIALNQWGLEKFQDRLRQEGIIIYDESIIKKQGHVDDVKLIPIKASDIAITHNSKLGANMVLLGALCAFTGLFLEEEIFKALSKTTPSHREDSIKTNKKLIREGFSALEDKKSENK